MPKQNILIAMLFLALSILAGCGTKGPLYIPEQRYPQKESVPETPQATPEASQPTTKE
jgi:predicted small lipoprotein YifL